MSKIVIADVLYTRTDETFYVLDKTHENASKYYAESFENAIANLKADGWSICGKVQKSDYTAVDMLTNGNLEYVAVWEE